jgi:phosphatidylinositol alpha-1,6-mannosyltransferase
MLESPSETPTVLLLSELFPPAIGGSAVLFGEIYSRIGMPVTVVSDGVATADFGMRNPRSLAHYLRLAARLRRAAPRPSMIHCGRAFPEGVAAWICRLSGGPRYACWAHGEDIATALLSRELTFLMRRVYGGAEVVFANSVSTRRMLLELGIPSARVEIVYPGVDTQRFRPDVLGAGIKQRLAPRGELLLLSVGRLQRRKGHDLMIEAVARLTGHPREFRYVIVGDGQERARLEGLVDHFNVRDHVTFAGEVPAEQLPQYFAACDVFALPNRIEQSDVEGFGIVFLEAAASGKPAIGGNSGGVPEAIADGVSGLLVSGTDAAELAATLARLMDSDALRRSLGEAGRARAVRQFGWDAAAERVAAVTRQVVNRNRQAKTIVDGHRAVTRERKAL